MKVDGISALVLVLIASVGTDQITTFIMTLLNGFSSFARSFPNPENLLPGPERVRAAKRQRVIYRFIAFLIGGVGIAGFGGFHLLDALGPDYAPLIAMYEEMGKDTTILGLQEDRSRQVIDVLVTGLAFMVGADKSSHILKAVGLDLGETPEVANHPIEVSGTLLLDPDAVTAESAHQA